MSSVHPIVVILDDFMSSEMMMMMMMIGWDQGAVTHFITLMLQSDECISGPEVLMDKDEMWDK